MFKSYTIHSNVRSKVGTETNKTHCSLMSCLLVLVIELKSVV